MGTSKTTNFTERFYLHFDRSTFREDIITNVNPSDGLSGDTLTLNISLNDNTRPPLPPQQIQPRSVSVGTIDLNNLTRPSRTTIRGTLKIPKNAQKGTKGITIIFPGPPGVNNVTFTGELAHKSVFWRIDFPRATHKSDFWRIKSGTNIAKFTGELEKVGQI